MQFFAFGLPHWVADRMATAIYLIRCYHRARMMSDVLGSLTAETSAMSDADRHRLRLGPHADALVWYRNRVG